MNVPHTPARSTSARLALVALVLAASLSPLALGERARPDVDTVAVKQEMCPEVPSMCHWRPWEPFLKVGPYLVSVRGPADSIDPEGQALLAQAGSEGLIWLSIAPDPEANASDAEFSFEMNDTPLVDWEQALARLKFAPGRGPDAANDTVEQSLAFKVPADAPHGRQEVPFTLRVGNQTLYSAFLLDVLGPDAEGASPAMAPGGAEGGDPGGRLVTALVALAAAALAAVAYAWRRRKRGDGA